jgi:hypothetical protein
MSASIWAITLCRPFGPSLFHVSVLPHGCRYRKEDTPMTMTASERDCLQRYVDTLGTGAGLSRDMIPGVVLALANVALKEHAIKVATQPPAPK